MHSACTFLCVNPEAHMHSNTYQTSFATYLWGISNHKLPEDARVSGPFPAGQQTCLTNESHETTSSTADL